MTNYNTLISVDEFDALRIKGDIIIIDCRFYLMDVTKGRKEYLECHVPGSVYFDTNHDLSSPVIKGVTGRHPLPDPAILEAKLRSAGVKKNQLVVTYDQSNGVYASRAWWLLRWLGHDNVAVLDGGFKAWTSAEKPIDNQWTLSEPGDFKARVHPEMSVTMNDLEMLHDPLVDSREYIRYSGQQEPIDPVAGHIPGAICVPYLDNTEDTGRWKSANELKRKFSDVEMSTKESPVFYCGSGVTACHNILAYKIATGKESRLYPGSWSEWINYHVVNRES